MPPNDPWKKEYDKFPARNEKEAKALELLANAQIDRIMEETGMSLNEFTSFIKWAKEYETKHLCVVGPRRN